MKRLSNGYLLIAVLFLFSSCARILNNRVQKVSVTTSKNVKVIAVDKALWTDTGHARRVFHTLRRKPPLVISVEVNDSIQKTVSLRACNSIAYWYNIMGNYGLGMLLDRDHPKRYGYPAHNYITSNDTGIIVRRFAPVRKGTVNFLGSLPVLHSFHMRDVNGKYSSGGVLGIEAGLEFFYKDDRYLSVTTGAATDRFGEYFGPGYYQSGKAFYGDVRNNHVVGSFDLGYGISLLQLNWGKHTLGDTIKIEQRLKNKLLGLSLSMQYRLGKYFRLGLLYQPGILNLRNKVGIDYQHHLSFQLIWKLPLRRMYE